MASSSIDPAILRSLSLSPGTATIKPHGGSGFASTARISTPDTSYFVKTSTSPGAAIMFEGEHASLNAIHNVVPSLCPRSIAWGPVDQGRGYFLVTEFVDLNPDIWPRTDRRTDTSNSKGSCHLTLAQKLARLHSTPAPMPAGFNTPQFGFPVVTCCGDTPQRNGFTPSWADFFAQHRLLMILEVNEQNNGPDAELRSLVEQVVIQVVPRLLGDGHLRGVVPVVIHGDLWAGNKGRGRFVAAIEDVIFDPSACYAHNEYEFGIMRMFGGFSNASFWQQYHQIVPKTEPESEYEDRHNKVLLLGGHGKIALKLTPLLLAKSWSVTSVVRNPDHKEEILDTGKGHPGHLDVLIDSLDDVTEEAAAKRVLDQVKPTIVVWSAGAGGKGGPARTKAVDEVAAKAYISASVNDPAVKKFLIISYVASRKGAPKWWTQDDKDAANKVNTEILPHYFRAKVEADEHLAALAHKRRQTDPSFQDINLRPGTLTDEAAGKVVIGRTSARGKTSRATTAAVAAALLSRDHTRGWYDVFDGDEDIDQAIDALVKEKFDGIEGEDLDRIYARA
ncbi:hypothetical protein DV736_g1036, partial [Chaetothyriales sp. CBS 134916]